MLTGPGLDTEQATGVWVGIQAEGTPLGKRVHQVACFTVWVPRATSAYVCP